MANAPTVWPYPVLLHLVQHLVSIGLAVGGGLALGDRGDLPAPILMISLSHMTEARSKANSRSNEKRWKSVPKSKRSTIMKRVGMGRWASMTKAERLNHMRMMTEARRKAREGVK